MTDKSKRRREREEDRGPNATASQASTIIGARLRERRLARSMTLQQLSDISNLSPSMLSLIERGRATPSIGSLILIAGALDAAISDLIPSAAECEEPIITRAETVPSGQSSGKLLRRILRQDHKHGLLISLTEYRPNTGTSLVGKAHSGFEHGFVISGELTVDFEGRKVVLGAGDMISYSSLRPHKIWNYSAETAKALWINIHGR